MRAHRFLASDSGAVTVDWTLLSAGLVGMGLATTTLVSGGAEDGARDIDGALRGARIFSGFTETLMAMTFTGGALGGWVGGEVRNFGGQMGEALFIPQARTATLSFDVPEGAQEATMALTLYGGDTLDGENAVISVNGTPVVIATGTHGRMSVQIPRVDGTFATAEVVVERVNLGTSPGSRYPNATDSKALVSIRVDAPPETLTLGVRSVNSHGHNGTDEFWAIDDVAVTAR